MTKLCSIVSITLHCTEDVINLKSESSINLRHAQ